MNDMRLDPLQTGVPFVAPGQIMDPEIMKLPHHPDHRSRLKADVGLDVLEAELTSVAHPGWSFRQLLAQIGGFLHGRWPASTAYDGQALVRKSG